MITVDSSGLRWCGEGFETSGAVEETNEGTGAEFTSTSLCLLLIFNHPPGDSGAVVSTVVPGSIPGIVCGFSRYDRMLPPPTAR